MYVCMKKRATNKAQLSAGFLYEPHLFGHDVLFPAPMHGGNRKGSKADGGAKKGPIL
jgi:hypothetical protein